MKSCYHCDSDIESNNQKCRNSKFGYCESADQIPMHSESEKSIKPEVFIVASPDENNG